MLLHLPPSKPLQLLGFSNLLRNLLNLILNIMMLRYLRYLMHLFLLGRWRWSVRCYKKNLSTKKMNSWLISKKGDVLICVRVKKNSMYCSIVDLGSWGHCKKNSSFATGILGSGGRCKMLPFWPRFLRGNSWLGCFPTLLDTPKSETTPWRGSGQQEYGACSHTYYCTIVIFTYLHIFIYTYILYIYIYLVYIHISCIYIYIHTHDIYAYIYM